MRPCRLDLSGDWTLAGSAGDFSNPENPLYEVYDALADWETQLKHAGVAHARTKPPERRL